MKRTMIYLPDQQRAQLEAYGRVHHLSLAQMVRDAVSAYLSMHRATPSETFVRESSGIWAGRRDIQDGVTYQRTLRKGGRRLKSLGLG